MAHFNGRVYELSAREFTVEADSMADAIRKVLGKNDHEDVSWGDTEFVDIDESCGLPVADLDPKTAVSVHGLSAENQDGSRFIPGLAEIADERMELLRWEIHRINSSHGRGDVHLVEIREGDLGKDCCGVVYRKIPTTPATGFVETRKFRVKSGTLTFLGRSRKLRADYAS